MKKQTTLTDAINKTINNVLKRLNTSIPAHIESFNPGTQLATIQLAIQRTDVNGKVNSIPPIINVPVCFPGGDFAVEFEVNPGDEGFALFSQRCLDSWVDQGGIVVNPITRKHDITDAVFIHGFRPRPKALTNFENNGIRLRNADGEQTVHLKNDGTILIKGAAIEIEAPTMTVTSPSIIYNVASFIVNGNFAVLGAMTNNGINIGSTHAHPYTWTDPAGSDVTGGPQ